jgi:two-component sensor histidine kinase
MALLHEKLYRSTNLAHINFATYVGDLCRHLMASFGPVARRVTLENRIARIGLPLEYSVPCGLIVNELLSNALKHGFPGERTGRIVV